MLYAGREVYSNSPLQFVAVEVRYTYVPALLRPEAREALAHTLRDITPVPSVENVTNITIGSDSGPKLETSEQFRLTNRAATRAIVFTPQRFVVETTAYNKFEEFAPFIQRAALALTESYDVAGLERIGLRYIDEIRVPDQIDSARDWSGWVDDRLIEMLAIREDPVDGFQAGIQYGISQHQHIAFRFGGINGPSVVGSSPLKRRAAFKAGNYFLLDIDSFWQAPAEIPQFSPEEVMKILGDLHQPAGEVFSSSITEKLKDRVLRKDVA